MGWGLTETVKKAFPFIGARSTAIRAPFNTREDGERAIRRAKRWLRNQSKGPLQVPPRHIFVNAELAVAQFGDDIAAVV